MTRRVGKAALALATSATIRRPWLSALAVALLGLATTAQPAQAEHDRSVPSGLTGSVSSAHFVLHYNPSTVPPASTGMTIAQYAQAGSNDFEESYSHLVTGGGGAPNAGLRAPTPDSDSKTDVYLSAPSDRPNFVGGTVYDDDHGPGSSYMFMTPGLGRSGFRFRSAHEFMHVIQAAYTFGRGDGIFEGFANWASELALSDVNPLDNNFNTSGGTTGTAPWLPLDCSFGQWEGRNCGDGYWQWLFVQRQVERYGADFVPGYYERFQSNTSAGVATLLDSEIQSQSGDAATLRGRFGEYARDVWDPTRWQTTAVAEIHDSFGSPASFELDRATADSGTQAVTVDHLAARYVHIVNDGGFAPSGPDDQVRITASRPAGMVDGGDWIQRQPWGANWVNSVGWQGASGSVTRTFGGDPASVAEIVVPLTNDTTATNDAAFSYRVERLPGTPTPPANDVIGGAARARLGQTATTDNVYAGGRGADETPGTGCDSSPNLTNATRGVWYRFTAPNSGQYQFNATASDFPAVVAMYETGSGSFQGCATSTPSLGVTMSSGQTFDVYVGRHSGRLNTGTQAKLLVTGPAGPAPQTSITSGPANGSTIDRARASFDFSASGSFPTFECRLDGAAFANCDSPKSYAGLSIGQHTFEVRATAGGATDATAASITFTVGPPANDSFASAQNVPFASGDLTGNNETASKEQGEPDHGGQPSSHSVWYRWRAQGTGQATIDTCGAGTTFDSTLSVYQGSSVGGLTGVAGNDDHGDCVNFQSKVTFNASLGEAYWIAVDGYEGATGDFELHIAGPPDTLPPDATIDSGPSGTATTRGATFTFSASEPGSTFRCRLDSDPAGFQTCPSPQSYSGLADGQHTFEVRAVDPAGNESPIQGRTWTIDATQQPSPSPGSTGADSGGTGSDGGAGGSGDGGRDDGSPAASDDATPPETTIDKSPARRTSKRKVSFEFNSSEPGSRFECRLDRREFKPCTSPQGLKLSRGRHTFDVRAIDRDGNVDPTPATARVKVGSPRRTPSRPARPGRGAPPPGPQARQERWDCAGLSRRVRAAC